MAQFQTASRHQYNMALESWAMVARDPDQRDRIVDACAHVIDAFRNHRPVSPDTLGTVADYWTAKQGFKCWEREEEPEVPLSEDDGYLPLESYHDR